MKSLFFLTICFVAVFVCGFVTEEKQVKEISVLTDIERINKYYTEETIKSEMSFLSMWHYVENMSEQEYYDTFFKVQHDK